MIYFAICVLVFIIQPIKCMDMMMKSSDKYGTFNLKSVDVETCRGTEIMDGNLFRLTCKVSTNADNNLVGTFDVSVAETFKLDEVKITVYNLKNDKKNVMWNYRLCDPCKHFAIGSLLVQHLKSEKCVLKPGKYNFELNFTEIVQKFLGKTFFYGDYFFKAIGVTKKRNLGCLMFHEVIEKASK